MERIKNSLKKIFKKRLAGKFRNQFIKNINLDLTKKQKRILISYLDYFAFSSFSNNKIGHTNILESIQIINVFKELDYIIDVVYCNSIESINFLKDEKYDVIFGFGEAFYEMCKINPNAKKIIYMTENHPNLSLKNELERINYFYERHRKKIPLRRSGIYYKMEHFENIDYALIMGEKEPFKIHNFKSYNIFPTGLINESYEFKERNYEETQKNFLWLGSSGAVHKGLDLLIEIFEKNPNWTLHICGFNREEKYLKIPKLSNIKEYGRIDIKSDLFLELAGKCSYIILPSCSEGCATSVLTGMLHSMIPIVCKDAGFNKLEDKCLFLEDYKIGYIEKELKLIIGKNNEWLDKKHKEIYKFSRSNFTLKNFTDNFREIIKEIEDEIK